MYPFAGLLLLLKTTPKIRNNSKFTKEELHFAMRYPVLRCVWLCSFKQYTISGGRLLRTVTIPSGLAIKMESNDMHGCSCSTCLTLASSNDQSNDLAPDASDWPPLEIHCNSHPNCTNLRAAPQACWSQVKNIYTLGERKNWATEELKTAVCKLISLRSSEGYESLLTATINHYFVTT